MDLIIYKIVPFVSERLSIRLMRQPHCHISRDVTSYTDTDGDKMHPMYEDQAKLRKRMLKPYRDIGLAAGILYSGVVMVGSRPCWAMLAHSRGPGASLHVLKPDAAHLLLDPLPASGTNKIRVHPMLIDGGISSFCALHNVNSPFGFAYLNTKGSFRVCQLPAQFNYDNDWGCCKVLLQRAAHKVCYHSSSETHVMTTSESKEFLLHRAKYAAAVSAGVVLDGDPLPEGESKIGPVIESEVGPGEYDPQIEQYQLHLVSPVTWETVDM